MKDTLDDITQKFNSIVLSNEKNTSRAREYRDLLERVLYYHFYISRSEKHAASILISKLSEHPEAFRKQLQTKARVLYKFFSEWSHDNPSMLQNSELEKHQSKLQDFIENAFDIKIPTPIYKDSLPKTSLNKTKAQPNIRTSSINEVRSYFKVAKNWYGKGQIITVRFKAGIYQDKTYIYDHDKMYDQTLSYLNKLPCWDQDGYYSNSRNIPGWAKDYLIQHG